MLAVPARFLWNNRERDAENGCRRKLLAGDGGQEGFEARRPMSAPATRRLSCQRRSPKMARHRSGSMFRYFRIYRSLLLPRFYQEISSQKTRTAGHFQISRKFSAPQAPGQRQRKEKQRVSGTSNEVSAKPLHAGARPPRRRSPARAGRRFPILVGTYSEYPRFKRTCTHVQVCAQRLFFWTVHGPFSFRQDEKKMGGGLPDYQHSLCPSHRTAPRQRAKKERGTCLSLFIRSLGRFKAIQTDSGSV